jgi:hypothetical protein
LDCYSPDENHFDFIAALFKIDAARQQICAQREESLRLRGRGEQEIIDSIEQPAGN